LGKENNIDLLLDCLGRKDSAEIAPGVEGLSDAEWQQLVELARSHGVIPLLYSRLKSLHSEGGIAAEIFSQLHNEYLKSGGRNTLLYNGLAEILQAFTDAGIPVIVIKGAYLAENVYKDISLRPMQDIDILLRKDDLQQGEKTLKKLGYSAYRDFLPGVDTDDYQHLLPMRRGNAAPVEVLWYLGHPGAPFQLDLEGIWQRARICRVGSHDALTLCPEDLLLYLCIHCSYQHNFEVGLLHLYDIKKILLHFGDEIDWDTIIMRASEWGCRRCVFLTLHLVEELFGVTLPAKIAQSIAAEGMDPQVAAAAYDQIITVAGTVGLAPAIPEVIQSEGVGAKMSVIAGRMFPSRKEMARMYPLAPDSPMVYLYYPVRFKDLLSRYGRGVWKMFTGDTATRDTMQRRVKGEELRQWLGER